MHVPPVTGPTASEEDFAVIVSGTQIIADDTPVLKLPSRAEQVRDGAPQSSGSLIVPLATLVQHREAGHPAEAIVIAEPGVPYRIIAQVIYTLGKSEIASFHFMVLQRMDAGTRAWPPPRDAGTIAPIPIPSGSHLQVSVTEQGVVFGKFGTIPKLHGVQDLMGARQYARRLKAGSSGDVPVTLGADPAVDYGTIIDVMDALRSDDDGSALFPDITFDSG